jgi:hypothetical protein
LQAETYAYTIYTEPFGHHLEVAVMKIMQIKLLVALYILLMSACTTSPTQTIEIETMVPATAKSPSISLDIIDFPKAQSQSLASGSDGTLYVIFGQNNSLFVSRSMDAGKTFGEPVLATGELPVHVLPIERPAIAVHNNTRVSIAWLEMPPDFNLWRRKPQERWQWST